MGAFEYVLTDDLKRLYEVAATNGDADRMQLYVSELNRRGWYWGDQQIPGGKPGWWQGRAAAGEPGRTAPILWVILAAVALSVASCWVMNLSAAEPAPSVDVSLLGWKLFVLDHDGTAYRRGGDLFGGRAIASMDLKAGLHLGLRGDASALSADFDLANPGTYRTLEGYGALSRPFAFGRFTAGPALIAGALVPVTTDDTAAAWASKPTWGGGARLAIGRSWLYLMAGTNGAADERAPGASPIRLLLAGQIEWNRVALVADFVSGPGGFARGGIAYRLPIPWGEQ